MLVFFGMMNEPFNLSLIIQLWIIQLYLIMSTTDCIWSKMFIV